MEINPRVMFERLFGGTAPRRSALASRKEDQSILDSISDEAEELQRGLPAHDRRRVDEYLDTIREIERRLQAVEGQGRTQLTSIDTPVGVPEAFDEHVGLMFDLLAIAYQADLTAVFTFLMAREASNKAYPQIGVPEPHHLVSHHGNKPEKIAEHAKINTYHVQQLAKFVEKLRATPDGDGSLLDHSADPLRQRDEQRQPALRRAAAAAGDRRRRRSRATGIWNCPRTRRWRISCSASWASSTFRSTRLESATAASNCKQLVRSQRCSADGDDGGWTVMRCETRRRSPAAGPVCGPRTGAADGNDVRLVNAIKAGDRAAVVALAQRSRRGQRARRRRAPPRCTGPSRPMRSTSCSCCSAPGANADAANRYGVTPLALAADERQRRRGRGAAEAGADANASLPEGQTVLMTAARTGNADTIGALLRAGAAVNAKESWLGETALMWAAVENHPAAVQRLVDGGADLNARSTLQTYPPMNYPATGLVRMAMPRGGWTALMYAARQGSLDAARALADAGADVNLTDPDRTTALLLALVNSHFDVAAMLVEHGANPNLADVTGKAALYTAVDARNEERLFSRPIAKRSSKINSLQFLTLLLDRGANPNARLSRSLLQKAHNAGDATLGAGSTPFMRAAKAGDVAAMRLLIDRGADPTLVQANGTTALDDCCRGRAGRRWRR